MIQLHNGTLLIDLVRIGWLLLSAVCMFTSLYVSGVILASVKEARFGREDLFPALATVVLIGGTGWFAVIVFTTKVMP